MNQRGKSILRTPDARLPARRALTGLRKLDGENGSSLFEFALIVILFMTMLMGISGFGLALYAYHFASNAAREATRYAAVRGSTCTDDGSCTAPAQEADIQNFVSSITPPGIDTTKLTTTPTWPVQVSGPTICSTTKNAPGCTVKVEVSYNFNFIFPLLPTSPLTLSSSSEMIIAH